MLTFMEVYCPVPSPTLCGWVGGWVRVCVCVCQNVLPPHPKDGTVWMAPTALPTGRAKEEMERHFMQ